MNKDAFSWFHPAVNLTFFLAAMIVDASKQMVRTEKGTITEIVDEDLRAFIESELVLAIIHTYDPYRMPDGQHITE